MRAFISTRPTLLWSALASVLALLSSSAAYGQNAAPAPTSEATAQKPQEPAPAEQSPDEQSPDEQSPEEQSLEEQNAEAQPTGTPAEAEPPSSEPSAHPGGSDSSAAGFRDATRPAPASEPKASEAPTSDVAPAPADASNQPGNDTGGYEDPSVNVAYEAPQKAEPVPFLLGLTWEPNFPIGPSRDFVKKFDAAGFGLQGHYRRLVTLGPARLGLGFAVAWHSMQEKTRSSIQSGNATITGTQIREVSTTPILGRVSLALGDVKDVSPYVSFGFGASRVLRRLDIGIYRFTDESWHLAMAPELGVEVPAGPLFALANVKMNYLVRTKDAPAQMYLNFCAGVGFD